MQYVARSNPHSGSRNAIPVHYVKQRRVATEAVAHRQELFAMQPVPECELISLTDGLVDCQEIFESFPIGIGLGPQAEVFGPSDVPPQRSLIIGPPLFGCLSCIDDNGVALGLHGGLLAGTSF